MSSSAWKSWKLNELSAKSFEEELSNASVIKAQLEESIASFEEEVKLFENQKADLFTSAKEEGFASGKSEGFKLGFEEGYESGKSSAIAEYENSLSIKLNNIEQISNNLKEFLDSLKSSVPTHLSNILKASLKKVLVDVKIESSAHLANLISEEINKLNALYQITLKVNTDDYEEIQNHFTEMFEHRGWKILKDPSLSSGGFLLESDDFHIDGSVERRLVKIFELIDHLGDNRNEQ